MPYSMTGYGRGECTEGGWDVTVEIKSVNSRYFEYTSRLPRGCAFMDDRLKKLLAKSVHRGKVELGLQLSAQGQAEGSVQVDWALAEQYCTALQELHERLCLPGQVSLAELADRPGVLTLCQAAVDEEALWATAQKAAQAAVTAFLQMRAAEGERMRADVLARLETLEAGVAQVEENSAGRVQAYTDRLYQKLQVLLEDRAIDESRLLTEAALFADKTAVDEETVRLHSHIAQYRQILQSDEPVGRKLDFLTQELNRETNTIGSKCQDLETTRTVVEMKAEIEKIREQIQNLE